MSNSPRRKAIKARQLRRKHGRAFWDLMARAFDKMGSPIESFLTDIDRSKLAYFFSNAYQWPPPFDFESSPDADC